MNTIKNEQYELKLDVEEGQLFLSGRLRLATLEDYQPIVDNLKRLSISSHNNLYLDITHLKFLNSLGIVVLSHFVIDCRKRQHGQIVVAYDANIPWQLKSINNLQRLLPSLILREVNNG